jgi:transcription initiation factor IIF auxiliary subunit
MSIHIGQDFRYVGNDYWNWWAWIDAPDNELATIQEVTWILHPSFDQTRVSTRDRASRFGLQSAGWGTFTLRAELLLEDGRTRKLRHALRLEYPAEMQAEPVPQDAAPRRQTMHRTVFLSYSSLDARRAARLRSNLESQAYTVLDQSMLKIGEPLAESLQRMVNRSDVVLALIPDDEIPPWVEAELRFAQAQGKPVLAATTQQARGLRLPDGVSRIILSDDGIDAEALGKLFDQPALDD